VPNSGTLEFLEPLEASFFRQILCFFQDSRNFREFQETDSSLGSTISITGTLGLRHNLGNVVDTTYAASSGSHDRAGALNRKSFRP